MMVLLRRFWPPGIRQQLALWYTVVFTLLLLLVGILAYKQLEYSLSTSLDASLAQIAQQIADDVTYDHGLLVIRNEVGTLPDVHPLPRDRQSLLADLSSKTAIRILDAQGNIVRQSPSFPLLHVPGESVSLPLLRMQSWQGTIAVHDDLDVRLYSTVIVKHGQPLAVVQVGQALSHIRSILHQEALVLLLIAPVVLLLSALVCAWLASRAFAPIHRLTSTARQIEAGDLHQRVPLPRARDEVHFLAVTLNEMIERLEQAFKRQRRFVADASHELRTPVAAIRSKTDLALLQELTPQQHSEVLRSINAEAERLGHLISDLLALARTDEGMSPLEREPVELAVLLEAVLANAELLAQERGITVRLEIAEPLTVQGDEARLIQLMMNLLDNALIYTQRGGSVTLKVARQDNVACLLVQDTGEGIAPEHLPHIFERFYRVDPARTRREGGSSGLGLAIVDWVVRAHQGSIHVESQPGCGSTFRVKLPLS